MTELDQLKNHLKGSFSKIREEMDELKSHIAVLYEENTKLKKQLAQKQVPTLQQEALQTVTKNKKIIVKQKILSMIDEKRHSIADIKETIVDQHGYCSKATFYRYIEELKQLHALQEMQVNERQIIVR